MGAGRDGVGGSSANQSLAQMLEEKKATNLCGSVEPTTASSDTRGGVQTVGAVTLERVGGGCCESVAIRDSTPAV